MPPTRDRIVSTKGFPQELGSRPTIKTYDLPTAEAARWRRGSNGVHRRGPETQRLEEEINSKVQTRTTLQGPNHKHQGPNKDQTEKQQIPNGEIVLRLNLDVCDLGFGFLVLVCYSVLVVWNLSVACCSQSRTRPLVSEAACYPSTARMGSTLPTGAKISQAMFRAVTMS